MPDRRLYIDQDALARACDELGIRAKVTVKLVAHTGACTGWHKRLPGRGGHLIHLAREIMRPRRGEETVWHELIHCVQDERDPFFEFEYLKQEKEAWSHEMIPYEREANRCASALAPLQSSDKRIIRRGYGPQEVIIHERHDDFPAPPVDLDSLQWSRKRRK